MMSHPVRTPERTRHPCTSRPNRTALKSRGKLVSRRGRNRRVLPRPDVTVRQHREGLMKFDDAFKQAQRVLAEEVASPTLTYRYTCPEWPRRVAQAAIAYSEAGIDRDTIARILLLPEMRKQRPRSVLADSACWQMKSSNYDRLVSIFKRLPEGDGSRLASSLLAGVLNLGKSNPPPRPLPWNAKTSPMPLLTEFCIRNAEFEVFMDALADRDAAYPTADLILATRQLEEMLAFNSNLFSRAQLGCMFRRLCWLWAVGLNQASPERGGIYRSSPIRQNTNNNKDWRFNGEELADSMDAIKEQCWDALRDRTQSLGVRGSAIPSVDLQSSKARIKVPREAFDWKGVYRRNRPRAST